MTAASSDADPTQPSPAEDVELAPPAWNQRARELLVGRDVLRLVGRTPALLGRTKSPRRPVLLITGFGGTDASLAPMRSFLRRVGHDARPVGLGRITDDVEALSASVGAAAEELASEVGDPVTLVGWSIGGVLAREAARDRPEPVRRVVTFGTPVVGGPSYTALADRYSSDRLAEIRVAVETRYRQPIRVPITAMWSRNDGVVSPAACIDRRSPDVEHVEVGSSHVGMGFDPDVWTTVADRVERG